MNELRSFYLYFCVAQGYILMLCFTLTWTFARASGNYLFWFIVGAVLAGCFSVQIYVIGRLIDRVIRSCLGICRIILLAISCTCFVWWMERVSLFFLGRIEGVPLFQPLIFLLDSLLVRLLIACIGVWGALFILHLFLIVFVVYVRTRVAWFLLGLLLCDGMVSFGVTFLSGCEPGWLKMCAIVRPSFVPGAVVNSMRHVNEIAHCFASVNGTAKKIIFMPESSLPFPFASCRQSGAALCSLSLGHTIFFGSQRDGGTGDVFNTVFCLRDGAVVFWHDKTHGMVGFERLPCFLQVNFILRGIGSLLGNGFFTQSVSSVPDICINAGTGMPNFLPLICSEFFYWYGMAKVPDKTTVVAMVNDAWFSGTVIPILLRRLGRLRALELPGGVLYVSYRYGGFFDMTGKWYNI